MLVDAPDAAATADDKGAASEFFIREKSEVTRVYDDWSCSSSSENGLKLVRIVTSSTSLVVPVPLTVLDAVDLRPLTG